MFSYLKTMDQSDLLRVLHIENDAYLFPWSLKGFENSLDQGLNYVFCSEDGIILGYCCLLPVLDEVQILNLCVSRQYQRSGIAKKALRSIVNLLKEANYKVVQLEVRASNYAARSLYKSFDFVEDGVRKGYYRDQQWDDQRQQFVSTKEDAILMSLPL